MTFSQKLYISYNLKIKAIANYNIKNNFIFLKL